MTEEYSKIVRISEAEASHPGFFYAMAKARFEMETPICEIKQGEPAIEFIRRLTEKMQEMGMAN